MMVLAAILDTADDNTEAAFACERHSSTTYWSH